MSRSRISVVDLHGAQIDCSEHQGMLRVGTKRTGDILISLVNYGKPLKRALAEAYMQGMSDAIAIEQARNGEQQ